MSQFGVVGAYVCVQYEYVVSALIIGGEKLT